MITHLTYNAVSGKLVLFNILHLSCRRVYSYSPYCFCFFCRVSQTIDICNCCRVLQCLISCKIVLGVSREYEPKRAIYLIQEIYFLFFVLFLTFRTLQIAIAHADDEAATLHTTNGLRATKVAIGTPICFYINVA